MNLVNHHYGSWRGLLSHFEARIAAAFGRHASAFDVDFTKVERLVFVCKGNVCRSPYAEARAASLGLPATSFGLVTDGGVVANPTALRIATARHVDLSSHASRSLAIDQIREGDLLIAFEPSQLEELRIRTQGVNVQHTLLGIWSTGDARPFVADPFGKCDEYFQRCFSLIDVAVDQLALNLRERSAA